MRRRKTTRAKASPPVAPGSARIESVVRQQQQRLAATLAALDTAGVEDVHGARVAARRLRSMLKTFRPLLNERRARLYRADLRSLAHALGTVREADVRRDLLLALARNDERLGAAERRRLGVLLDDACISARDSLRRHRAEPGWAALCGALERHRAGTALFAVRDADLHEVVRLVARSWRRPVRLLRQQPEDTAELHELRLAFKHCRYALETLADVAPKDTARLLRRLRAAQDRIGEHRDTLLAEHWVRENEPTLGRPLVGRLAADLRHHEKALRRQSAARALKVLDAWTAWRDATQPVRREARRDRG